MLFIDKKWLQPVPAINPIILAIEIADIYFIKNPELLGVLSVNPFFFKGRIQQKK